MFDMPCFLNRIDAVKLDRNGVHLFPAPIDGLKPARQSLDGLDQLKNLQLWSSMISGNMQIARAACFAS